MLCPLFLVRPRSPGPMVRVLGPWPRVLNPANGVRDQGPRTMDHGPRTKEDQGGPSTKDQVLRTNRSRSESLRRCGPQILLRPRRGVPELARGPERPVRITQQLA